VACFWTDEVNCTEDCSDVSDGYIGFVGPNETCNGSDLNLPLYATLAAWQSGTDLDRDDASTVELTSCTFYVPNSGIDPEGENCVWKADIISTHDDETVGQPAPATGSGFTYLAQSTAVSGAVSTYTHTGSLVLGFDGANHWATLSQAALATFLSMPDGTLQEGIFVCTVVNTTTGAQYSGSWTISSCC
jgi:hypothetical protein